MKQEIVYYPLTQSQKMMFMNLKYSIKKQVVNICTGMHFDCEIDAGLMRQAVSLALLRNKAASIRLHTFKEVGPDGKKHSVIKQYFSDAVPNPMEVASFETEEAMQEAIRTWSSTPFPNKSMDTQLFRVVLVEKPNGRYLLYFCVSHVVYDAYSLMATCKDLLGIYTALRDGTPMPHPLPSPLEAYQSDWDYDTSPQYEKDKEFWANEAFGREPEFTSVNGSGSRDHRTHKGKHYGVTLRLWEVSADQVNLTIPKEVAEKVTQYGIKNRVPPQVVYMLAIRAYFSKVNGGAENVLIYNTVARRATLAQKRAGGTMVQAVPFFLDFSNDMPFSEACRLVQQLQNKYYRHANIPLTEVVEGFLKKRFNLPPCRGYCGISLTFQPYSVAADPTVPVHFERFPNYAATLPLYLSIMALDQSGALVCNYEYITKHTTPEKIRAFHEAMVRFVSEAVDSPEKTLKQLM